MAAPLGPPAPRRPEPAPVWQGYADRLSKILLLPRPPEESAPSKYVTLDDLPPGFRSSGKNRAIGSRRSALVLAVLAIAVAQVYYLGAGDLGILGSYVAYLMLPVGMLLVLALFLYAQRATFADIGFRTSGSVLLPIAIGVGLAGLFLLVEFEPGALLGLPTITLPSPDVFALITFSAPLLAASQEGVFRGYVLRAFAAGSSFPRSLYLSSGFFALTLTSLPIVATLRGDLLGQYLFTTTLEALVLGMAMGFLVYKSGWTLVAAICFRSIQIVQTTLFPELIRSGNWSVPFTLTLLAYAAVLLVVSLLVQEPRAQARRYMAEPIGRLTGRFRERSRLRRELVTTGITAVIVLAAVGGGYLILLQETGVRQPLLAIPTGSMVPTIEPGDLVVIQATTPAQVHVGEIVAYRTTCFAVSPVVHRVIAERITASGTYIFTTKGDHNPSPDPCPVPGSAIVGKVIAIIPAVGYFILEPFLGVALVIGVVAAPLMLPQRKRRFGQVGT